jgi:hypothetical protein
MSDVASAVRLGLDSIIGEIFLADNNTRFRAPLRSYNIAQTKRWK